MFMRSTFVILLCAGALSCGGAPDVDGGTARDASIELDAGASIDAGPADAGPPIDPTLDRAVRDAMSRGRLPGLAAAIVKDGELAWTGAWGEMNLAEGTPVRADTIFMVASISKAIAALAVMRAVEAGLVDLDANINDYLPFSVRHPTSSTAITLRQLLTHTSGIRDDNAFIWGNYTYGADASEPLGDYLERYLSDTGADYADTHFGAPPATAFEYSNMGAALTGYVIEAAAGQRFGDYCQQTIFDPMGLTDSHWWLRDTDIARTALPYRWTGSAYETRGHYGYPDYPNGQLRTTVTDLANVLRMVIGDGRLAGARILEAASVAELSRRQIPSIDAGQGLAWSYIDAGDSYLGHDGEDEGVTTDFFIRQSDQLGVVVLANGRSDDRRPFDDIEVALMDFADARL